MGWDGLRLRLTTTDYDDSNVACCCSREVALASALAFGVDNGLGGCLCRWQGILAPNDNPVPPRMAADCPMSRAIHGLGKPLQGPWPTAGWPMSAADTGGQPPIPRIFCLFCPFSPFDVWHAKSLRAGRAAAQKKRGRRCDFLLGDGR